LQEKLLDLNLDRDLNLFRGSAVERAACLDVLVAKKTVGGDKMKKEKRQL